MKSLYRLLLLFLISCLTACQNEPIVIGLQPLGKVDPVLLDSLSTALKVTYSCKVVKFEPIDMPSSVFVNIKTPRYRADSLLIYLEKIKPDSISNIMGVTSLDISTTKRNRNGSIKQPESKYRDWGVFGLGYRPGKASIISTYRIKGVQDSLFFERVTKIAIHELGHNCGLPHCTTPNCVMQDAAETVATVDKVERFLCGSCKKMVN